MGMLKAFAPLEEIRPKLDIGWRLDRLTIYLYEIRPQWDKPKIIRHFDCAKATWLLWAKEWRIYWLRASLKWDSYQPLPVVNNLQRFIIEVEKDPYGCFKG
jgi:hypothetical protein